MNFRCTNQVVTTKEVDAAISGDLTAFENIINKTRNAITCIALAIVKDIDMSEDVAQHVYISVWQNLQTLKNSSSFLPWLRQTTRYTAFKFLRDNKGSIKVSGDEAEQLLASLANEQSSLEDSQIKQQQTKIIRCLIDDLPTETREIVLLYYREEQSSKQVAMLLDMSETNVRKKLSRVRKLLKEQLLNKYGKVILSTAPTLGLTSIVLSALTVSKKSLATTYGISHLSSQIPLSGKVLPLISGVFIGPFTAILAIFIDNKKIIEKMPQHQHSALNKLRNQTITLVAIAALLLVLTYIYTSHWFMPTIVYATFTIGMLMLEKKRQSIINSHYQRSDDSGIDKKINYFIFENRKIGLYLGLIAGVAGLIYGLTSVNS